MWPEVPSHAATPSPLPLRVPGVTLPLPSKADAFVAVNREVVRYGAHFHRTNDASTIFTSIEEREPLLEWTRIVELTRHVKVVFLTFCADLCAANNRVKHKCKQRAKTHIAGAALHKHGYIILFDNSCGKHVLHRIADFSFKFERLLPNLHATAYTSKQPKQHLRLLTSCTAIVAENIRNHFYLGIRPTDEHRRHTELLLETTLKRRFHVRAQSEQESPIATDLAIHAPCERISEFFEGIEF